MDSVKLLQEIKVVPAADDVNGNTCCKMKVSDYVEIEKTIQQLQAELDKNKYLMEHGTAMYVAKLQARIEELENTCEKLGGDADFDQELAVVNLRLNKENMQLQSELTSIKRDLVSEVRGHINTQKQLKQLQAELNIALLEVELIKHVNRWIPVSERLPEDSGHYQVLREANTWPTTRYYYTGNRKQFDSNDVVTHWKEIDFPATPAEPTT